MVPHNDQLFFCVMVMKYVYFSKLTNLYTVYELLDCEKPPDGHYITKELAQARYLFQFLETLGSCVCIAVVFKMIVPGNDKIEAELSLDQTPQLS